MTNDQEPNFKRIRRRVCYFAGLSHWLLARFFLLTRNVAEAIVPPMPIPSVLIVDSSDDNREVLRTVLSRRGMRTIEADQAEQGLQLARIHRPDVIVLDVDEEQFGGQQISDQFAEEAGDDCSQLIVVGRFNREKASRGSRMVSKPYHFGSLIHTIEQLAAKAA
jgi:CheY-like chemotaxis protein